MGRLVAYKSQRQRRFPTAIYQVFPVSFLGSGHSALKLSLHTAFRRPPVASGDLEDVCYKNTSSNIISRVFHPHSISLEIYKWRTSDHVQSAPGRRVGNCLANLETPGEGSTCVDTWSWCQRHIIPFTFLLRWCGRRGWGFGLWGSWFRGRVTARREGGVLGSFARDGGGRARRKRVGGLCVHNPIICSVPYGCFMFPPPPVFFSAL